MHLEIVTLFPELFSSPLSVGLLGKALAGGLARVGFVDPRSLATDKHHRVDDTPYGGGAGMVMKPGPLVDAIERARGDGARVVMLTPQGKPLEQADFQRWSSLERLVLVCGRYEGFDERARAFVDEEISLGDFVLTGGEYGALVIIDGVVRLREGTLGNQSSTHTDSFADGLLEHPHYTRPESFRGVEAPEVLRTGDHRRISSWRREQSLLRTLRGRSDLLVSAKLSAVDQRVLLAAPSTHRLAVAVCTGDVEGIVDLVGAYGLSAGYAITSDAEASRWLVAPSRRAPPPRRGSRKQHELLMIRFREEELAREKAASRVSVLESTEQVLQDAGKKFGELVPIFERPADEVRGSIPAAWLAAATQANATPLLIVGDRSATQHSIQDTGLVARVRAPFRDRSPLVAASVLIDRLLGES
ncbi:MAG: tRNA (guanosine(37)-N1)-methyltransferase TrmD [Deltaproteobacteria bacterium]|nr:tRNA (guanosine(37)-N1)-methyltransferase TrmD [Deltaproteobacteria bacterium]